LSKNNNKLFSPLKINIFQKTKHEPNMIVKF
jgi:hypothetical protein